MEWQVTTEESGLSLITFLRKKLPEHSARALKKLIESNACLVNRRTERFSSFALAPGDQVVLLTEIQPEKVKEFEESRILFEDQSLLIYNKPPGINSDQLSKELILVHRLDRDTSGVLIFAKTETIFEKMKHLFKQHLVKKSYLAIVDGIPKKAQGTIENELALKHRYQGQSLWGSVAKGKGQVAITRWKKEKSGNDASLLRCWPITGRTHQIRVHLSELGHPILGDYQYGRRFHSPYRPTRCLLHAESIEFPHPVTGQMLHMVAPVPDDFNLETAI